MLQSAGLPPFFLFTGGPEGARALLSAIISSMISFTALVFSITIVVLQLTSGQFSPRVLRTFGSVRAGATVEGLRSLGGFVAGGGALFRVYGDGVDDERLIDAVLFGKEHTNPPLAPRPVAAPPTTPPPVVPSPCVAIAQRGSDVLAQLDAAARAVGALDPAALRQVLDEVRRLRDELQRDVDTCRGQVSDTRTEASPAPAGPPPVTPAPAVPAPPAPASAPASVAPSSLAPVPVPAG